MPAGQRKHRAANVIIDEAPAVQGSNKTPMIYAQNGVSRATDNAQDTTTVLQGHIAGTNAVPMGLHKHNLNCSSSVQTTAALLIGSWCHARLKVQHCFTAYPKDAVIH